MMNAAFSSFVTLTLSQTRPPNGCCVDFKAMSMKRIADKIK